uniref:Peptidase A2 domain-containing protein n=1 Tax=Photinus pyralis TaxID=7054 RepID=A0A1Y1KEL4_PHOPY
MANDGENVNVEGRDSAPVPQYHLANISPPGKFNFAIPASWPQWKKRFERYMTVSGYNTRADTDKVDMLLYVMGEEAEEVIPQLNLERASYKDVMTKLEDHFIPQRNVIFERFKFNSRVQRPGESVDNFVTALHSLAEHCQYANLKDELIRDRIVVGLLDVKTSERMQLQKTLTLQEATQMARQAETQASQNLILRQEGKLHGVAALHNKGSNQFEKTRAKFSNQRGADNHASQEGNQSSQKKCSRCGQPDCTNKEKCPARNSICRKCSKKGHWGIACRSKGSVKAVMQMDDLTEEEVHESAGSCFYLGCMFTNSDKQWLVNIVIDSNLEKTFLVDTGADVICIPNKVLPKGYNSKIIECTESIGGPDSSNLKVIGKVKLELAYRNEIYFSYVYVIENLKLPILGRPGIVKLNILKVPELKQLQVCTVEDASTTLSKQVIEEKYAGIFKEIKLS